MRTFGYFCLSTAMVVPAFVLMGIAQMHPWRMMVVYFVVTYSDRVWQWSLSK